ILAEVLPLAIAGIAAGLVLAWWLIEALRPYLPARMPRAASIGLHWPVVAFAIAVSFSVVLLASLLPARLAVRRDPGSTLQQGTRSVTSGGGARNLLVVGQVAVTLVLLFGGLLFARSFSAIVKVNPGFSSDGVITLHMAVTRAKYREDE